MRIFCFIFVTTFITGVICEGNLVFGRELKVEELSYGKTSRGEVLKAYKFYKNIKSGSRAVIITGGVHGNEHMGLVDKLLHFLKKEEITLGYKGFFDLDGVIYIIPRVNPDGVKIGSRYSAMGKDLNRLFLEEKINEVGSNESSLLARFLEKDLARTSTKAVFAMDYHCCAGGVLLANKPSFQGFYKDLESLLQKTIDPSYFASTTEKVFGKHFTGTLKDFLSKKYKIPAITYEGGNPKGEIKKLKGHLVFWDKLLKRFASDILVARKADILEKKVARQSSSNKMSSSSKLDHSE